MIAEEIPGDAVIIGGMFDEHRTHDIAAALRTGPLAVSLGVTAVRPFR